jgi:hypothetical protein
MGTTEKAGQKPDNQKEDIEHKKKQPNNANICACGLLLFIP